MTQTDKILQHLEKYGSITPLEAMKEYGIMRLASRICDIKRAGISVQREIETAKNRDGEPVRYARYTIPNTQEERKNA